MSDRKPSKVKRVLPPVSKAVGGSLPGIDLADARLLQEADDIDAVRRLTRAE